MESDLSHLEKLASYRACIEGIACAWAGFLQKREQRLQQQQRLGEASEKVAENILEDLSLDRIEPPTDLWWLSVQGIWRERPTTEEAELRLLPETPLETALGTGRPEGSQGLLHPMYNLPARCFAYVGDYGNPKTWKLPYLQADGTIDAKRLPKAVQAILSNYRGAKVSGIPEVAIRAVLTKLGRAALQAGHMPPKASSPAPIYCQLAEAPEQLGTTCGDS